jgi:hypothetical protein
MSWPTLGVSNIEGIRSSAASKIVLVASLMAVASAMWLRLHLISCGAE